MERTSAVQSGTDSATDESLTVQTDAKRTTPRWLDAIVVPLAMCAASIAAHMLIAWEQSRVLRINTRGLLSRWDGGFYLKLAKHGYPTHLAVGYGGRAQNTLGFFPGYPILVRLALHLSSLPLIQNGLIVAMLCAAGAALVMWQLASRLCGTEVAHRSVAFFVFAPGAVVLSMPYSEGLFILLAAACLLMLVDRRWEWAGVFALFACVTRPNGLAVAVACAVAAFFALRDNPRNVRPLAAPVLAALGVAALPLYDWIHVGDPLAYWKTQHRGWGQGFDFGANTLNKVWGVIEDPLHDFNLLMATFAIIVIIGGLVLMVRWRPPAAIVAYTLVVVAMALTSSQLVSTFRFEMTAFPLAIAYARVTKGTVFGVALAISAVFFTVTAVAATTLLYTP
jgi:Gpi18-like mannosyltransferase